MRSMNLLQSQTDTVINDSSLLMRGELSSEEDVPEFNGRNS